MARSFDRGVGTRADDGISIFGEVDKYGATFGVDDLAWVRVGGIDARTRCGRSAMSWSRLVALWSVGEFAAYRVSDDAAAATESIRSLDLGSIGGRIGADAARVVVGGMRNDWSGATAGYERSALGTAR